MLLDKKNPTCLVELNENSDPLAREQLVTLSSDGHLLFWSLDFNDPKEKKKTAFEEFNFQNMVWKAFFSIQLFQEDLKPLITSKMVVQFHSSTQLFCTASEGSLVQVEYNISKLGIQEQSKAEVISKRWGICTSHNVFGLDSSPFIQNLFLVISDTCFYLFWDDYDCPLFVSPFLLNTKLVCGKFSQSRPGVIFIGREDGILDIWDFAEQTGVPSQQHLVSAAGIDYVCLNKSKSNLIAVGDFNSCVHLLNLPQSLCKNDPQEVKLIVDLLRKEQNKFKFLEGEFEKQNTQLPNSSAFIENPQKEAPEEHLDNEIIMQNMNKQYEQFLQENFFEQGEQNASSKQEEK